MSKKKEKVIARKKNRIDVRRTASFSKDEIRIDFTLPAINIGVVNFILKDDKPLLMEAKYIQYSRAFNERLLEQSSANIVDDIIMEIKEMYPKDLIKFIDIEFLEFDLRKILT